MPRNIKLNLNFWSIASFMILLLLLLPNLNILAGLLEEPTENWLHIRTYLLQSYIKNSLVLVGATAVMTIITGTLLAYLVAFYDFPLRGFMRWALILPLAVPPYMAAYTYSGIVSFTGPIQTFLRNTVGVSPNQKYFQIMSPEGAVFIFSLFLYPYVYLMVKAFFEKQSSALIESAQLLGRSPVEILIYTLLPLARPAIIGGVSLVIMEVLNDYGVVHYFGIPVFSTAIFRAWFGMGDLNSAIKLAGLLMILVFATVVIEKLLRGRLSFSYSKSAVRPLVPRRLHKTPAILALTFCLLIFSFGFVIPVFQLFYWGLLTYRSILNYEFIASLFNSVMLAGITSSVIVILALIIGNFARISTNQLGNIVSRIALIGYSIPGTVIAIGVVTFFIQMDSRIYWLYKPIIGGSKKLVLSTSIVMLVFAYIIRFLAIGYNAVDSGFEKIGRKYFEASRTLGANIARTFLLVDLPMLKPAVTGGFILVFVDILKELPLTLILRPFNFHTLATKAFQYANDEMVQEAAIASLIIITVSFLSIYLFYKTAERT